jgi:hypothetical protein
VTPLWKEPPQPVKGKVIWLLRRRLLLKTVAGILLTSSLLPCPDLPGTAHASFSAT